MDKKVSIIVPVYNTEGLLGRCLDRLVGQTYSNIEVICVDDGSTDGSLEVLRSYAGKDERIKVVSQANAGAGAARNKGLDLATGEYVMFCDSDDFYEPQMCELMVKAMVHKNVDLVTCDFKVVSEDGGYSRDEENNIRPDLFGYHSLKDAEKKKRVNSNLWNKVFKREIIERYHLRLSDSIKVAEDWCFFIPYICVIRNLYGLDQCLYNYQMRQNSLMSVAYSNKDDLFDRMTADRIITDKLVEIGALEANFEYWIGMSFKGLNWLCHIATHEEQRVRLLDAYNHEILDGLDLDVEVAHSKWVLDELRDLKDRKYAGFLARFGRSKSQNPVQRKNRWKSLVKGLLTYVKSCIFFPYYIYGIYKILQKYGKDR